MDNLIKQTEILSVNIADALDRLQIEKLENELAELKQKTAEPELWQDQDRAQRLMKEQSDLESRIAPWRDLDGSVRELKELLFLKDDSLEKELNDKYQTLESNFSEIKSELLLNGKYDSRSLILSIHAGAGGTDAQDWAQMLLRMYIRYCESQNFKTIVIDQSDGEQAGLKSVTLEIDGNFAYGKLKGEHGVHRLVRLSPFNSDNLRQTSFAKVEIMPKIDKPDEVEIDDADLKIDVYRSGGKGGQSVNTTDSAVRITHLPTGIVIAIQNERSQLQNKETAMTILRSKLAQLQIEQHAKNLRELKGPNEQAAWGNQIRSYVLHPYKQVKDLRTNYVTSEAESVLDGEIDNFVNAYLEHNLGQSE